MRKQKEAPAQACPNPADHELCRILRDIRSKKATIRRERDQIYKLAIAAEQIHFRNLAPGSLEDDQRRDFIAGLCYINWGAPR